MSNYVLVRACSMSDSSCQASPKSHHLTILSSTLQCMGALRATEGGSGRLGGVKRVIGQPHLIELTQKLPEGRLMVVMHDVTHLVQQGAQHHLKPVKLLRPAVLA